MAAHSKVGASSAKRWMTCPGSVRMIAPLPNTSSPAAREGTAAHQVAEECLLAGAAASSRIGDVIDVEGDGIVVTTEMAEAVQVYLDEVAMWLSTDPEAVLHVETRFHLDELHPDLFGTNDACIWLPGQRKLIVLDYKHGAGTYVDARANPQLRYYALGALFKFGYPATAIVSGVCQPRCDKSANKVRYDEPMSPVDLLDWAADLVAAVRATEAPDAPLVPGDHCRGTFCGAYAICPAVHKKAQELAKVEFGPAVAYDPQLLAQALAFLPTLEGWIKAVRETALASMESGGTVPGWKLVPKRATRKWANEESAVKFMGQHLDESKFIEVKREVASPAQAEKLLKSLKVPLPDELVVKESSGYTLAPDDDARPAVIRGGEFPVA